MIFNLLKNKKQEGYTLVEILVVIAIIGILSSVTFVAFSSAREKSRMSTAKMFEANHVGTLRNYLVAEWLFDDPTNRYLDSSGNGHNGTCSNCPTVATGEGFNNKDAMRFDGVNDQINLGIGSDYFPIETFTTCSWIKFSELGTSMTHSGVFSMTYVVSLFVDGNGNLASYLDETGIYPFAVFTQTKVRDDKFHFICLSSDSQKRNMYTDGNLKSSTPSAWPGTTSYPTNGVVIGLEINNPSISLFKGLIDDVRVYSSVLSTAQIQKLYAEESAQRKLAEAK